MSKFNFHPQSFRKYFTNTSWLLAERVIDSIILLIIGVYIARYLGPSQFGLLNYARSFVYLFFALSYLGLESIIVRDLVNRPEEREVLLGTGLGLKLIGSFLALLTVAFAVQFTSNDSLTNLLTLIIATGFFFQSFDVIDYYFQSTVQSKYVALAKFIQVITSTAIKISLVMIRAPLIWFAVVILLESILKACGLLVMYKKNKLSIRAWQFNRNMAKTLLKNSYPLFLGGLAFMIYMKIDQVMIKEMLDDKAVGFYAAAVRLYEAWYPLPVIISSSVFPAILNARKKSKEIYYNRLQRLYNLLVLLAIGIAATTTLFGKEIIRILYGTEFANAGPVLQIYAWAGVFIFLGVANEKWLLAENLTKIYFYRAVCGVICNILLNWIFISLYGINGAAYASLLTQVLVLYLFDLFNKKTLISFKMKSKALILCDW